MTGAAVGEQDGSFARDLVAPTTPRITSLLYPALLVVAMDLRIAG